MRCEEIQGWFGDYWDLPEDDLRRQAVNQHIRSCSSCAEEFEIWQESMELIHSTAVPLEEPAVLQDYSVSKGVMDRIYHEEAWRIPVAERVYAISYKMRRNLTLLVSFCLALFLFSFLYSLVYVGGAPEETYAPSNTSGVLDVASAMGDGDSLDGALHAIPVASLSDDPIVLKITAVPTTPDYYVVLSILGLIAALLIMNWLSRTRA